MAAKRKRRLELEAERAIRAQMDVLGRELRRSRTTRRLTQSALAQRVGLAQSTISEAELGRGGTLAIDTWQRLAAGLGRELTVRWGRDPRDAPVDAGHLGIQELILRLGRNAGYGGSFELATRARDPALSTDVGLTHLVARRLVLVECVNTIGDLGASTRSSDRKRRDAEDLAVALGGEEPYAVHTCWVIRSTRRNRSLVSTYPTIFDTRFPGSSAAWVTALTTGSVPPAEAGVVWCDLQATRLFARRRSGDP